MTIYIDEQGFTEEYLEIKSENSHYSITLEDILSQTKDIPKSALMMYVEDDYGDVQFSFKYKRKATDQELKQQEKECKEERERIRNRYIRQAAHHFWVIKHTYT